MRHLSRLAAGLLLVGIAAGCERTPMSLGHPVLKEGSPESAGFSSARLARIDSLVDSLVAQGRMAGAVALIARNGTIVYHKALGYDDVEARRALDRDQIFRIASQSKAITSVAAMILYEEGKFLLDDPIAKYLPEFEHPNMFQIGPKGDTTVVPAKRPVTVRQLLSHTSGIGYPVGGAAAWYGKEGIGPLYTFGVVKPGETLATVVSRMARVPLNHEPGTRWTYGFSVDVLGRLVEVWSGMTLDEFVRKRLLGPLGMRDTYFNVPGEKRNRVVNFFRIDTSGAIARQTVLGFAPMIPTPDSLPLDYALDQKVYFGGGGAMSSTVRDYAVFLQMMLNRGEYNGVRILSPNTVRMMTQNQIGDLMIDSAGRKFGLGFSVATETSSGREPEPAGSIAWGGALGTTYWADPKNGIVALFYRQTWGPDRTGISQRFPILVYQALVEEGDGDSGRLTSR